MENDSLWRWEVMFFLVIVFAAGTAFGRFVIPLLFRDHFVLVIHGSEPEGCLGDASFSPVRFGRQGESSAGSYHIECDERLHPSYNRDLLCDCRE